jgi:hypothetical protein
MRSSLPEQAWQQLSRSMTGQLLLPEDDQFETLRRPATNQRRIRGSAYLSADHRAQCHRLRRADGHRSRHYRPPHL